MAKLQGALKNYWLLVLMIFLFWGILNIIWAWQTQTIPHTDMARHLYASLIYDQNVNLANIHRSLVTWIDGYEYYPPLVYVLTKPFYRLFGYSIFGALTSNLLWLGILIFSTYGIAKNLWNKKVGLTAVLILAATPILVAQFKEYMLDGPLIAWVALSVYLLIKSENYSKQSYNLLLGVILGLGMLLKWTYIGFVIFPVLYFFVLAVSQSLKEKKWQNIFNFIFVVITAVAISFPWYYIHRTALIQDFRSNGLGDSDPTSLRSIWTWLFYPIQSLNFYFFLPLGLIVWIMLITSIILRKFRNILLLGSFLIPWLIFVLLPNKDLRYFIPALLFVILIVASGIAKLPLRYQKPLVGFLIVAFLFYQINLLVGWQQDKKVLIPISRGDASRRIPNLDLAVYRQFYYTTGLPDKENWHVEDIVSKIKANNRSSQEKIKVVFLGQQDWKFNFYTLLYYSQKNQPFFDVSDSVNGSKADFAISFSDIQPAPGKLMAEFAEPNGSQVKIYDLQGK